MIKTMDPNFIEWVKQHLDDVEKTKQILTALLRLLSPKWWKKNWQRIAIRFFLAIFAFVLLFRFVPVPFSSYMAQQQVGHWLQGNFHYWAKSTWVSLEKISPHMQLAVIAAEDQKFPSHYGFDFTAIQKAFKHNGKSTRKIRGGSTISQQTAKI
ncbi:monofunctional biosynthetic peptidoglycan transglycosylase [Rodentibacter pneumotropicus]|uniref:Monofunctional biosynthetic peptidoglycan transglycosylase n=1 Tax=Rodentibacter pneumotropicus TaxID=758 RepID=A0A3S4XST5_9PAST|nr:monofunctional biosynthetic peptidoglycan transglycosylase [Rodentibacter pneumotropicus]